MEVRRPFEMVLPEKLLQIAVAFRSAGHQLFVVGGAVRDAVMGIEPHDYDLATDATPEQVTEIILGMIDWNADETGKSFGVIRARVQQLNELCEYEIATFREDLSMGRHPEVRFATIVEDVQRRDLTINALFYDIEQREIVDLVDGLGDLASGLIRMVGHPEDRFAEDRLRVLRAIRFAARFDYKIQPTTYNAIARDNNLDGVSFERIRDEIVKALESARNLSRFFDLMAELDMWTRALPNLKVDARRITSRNMPVVLALMLEDVDLNTLGTRLNCLKYSSDEISQVLFLLRFRELSFANAYKLRKLADRVHITDEQINDYCEDRMLPHPRLTARFLKYRPSVSGDVLLEQGFVGAELGRELERQETLLFTRLHDG